MASNQRTDGSVEIGCADPQHERIGLACPTCGAVAVHAKGMPLSDAAVQGLIEQLRDIRNEIDLDWCDTDPADCTSNHVDGNATVASKLAALDASRACLAELLEGRARLAKVRAALAAMVEFLKTEDGEFARARRGAYEKVLSLLDAPVDRTGEK